MSHVQFEYQNIIHCHGGFGAKYVHTRSTRACLQVVVKPSDYVDVSFGLNTTLRGDTLSPKVDHFDMIKPLHPIMETCHLTSSCNRHPIPIATRLVGHLLQPMASLSASLPQLINVQKRHACLS